MTDLIDRLMDHVAAGSDSKELLVAAANEIALLRQDVVAARAAFTDWQVLVMKEVSETHVLLCQQAAVGDRLALLAATPIAWGQTQLEGIG